MGLWRHREDLENIRPEQKWDYINLDDFKSTSCFAPLSYGILYISVFISFAVYGVDSFTAINLLVFSRWASGIKPKIPFAISKWIFAGCIIFSFVVLIFRWIRAIRVIKSRGVAESYLDPLAARIQSTRMGKNGKGWRRFLVFADLTKSKKGADYVALFVYFNFEAWLRVVFAEGPCQVINGITLYSVMQLSLIPQGKHAAPKGTSPVRQFFLNVEALAEKDKRQAVILLAMLFTVVIWVVAMLSLATSLVLYLLFLWHHIPSSDGTLTAYCQRKINTRLARIVTEKVDKALSKGVALQNRRSTDPEAAFGGFKRQPTLPMLDHPSTDKLPEMPSLSRQTTVSTLPPYSRPGTVDPESQGGFRRQATLPDLSWHDDDRPVSAGTPRPRLSDDTAPLVGNAFSFGYSNPGRYQPGAPILPPIDRQGTPVSLMSGPKPPTPDGHRTPGPILFDSAGRSTPGMARPGNGDGYSLPSAPSPSVGRRTPFEPLPSRSQTPSNGNSATIYPGGYVPFRPNNNTGTPDAPNRGATPGPVRNFARPSITTPSNEHANSPSDRTHPQRAGATPPPQDQLPYTLF